MSLFSDAGEISDGRGGGATATTAVLKFSVFAPTTVPTPELAAMSLDMEMTSSGSLVDLHRL
jgi:hypothetical protein